MPRGRGIRSFVYAEIRSFVYIRIATSDVAQDPNCCHGSRSAVDRLSDVGRTIRGPPGSPGSARIAHRCRGSAHTRTHTPSPATFSVRRGPGRGEDFEEHRSDQPGANQETRTQEPVAALHSTPTRAMGPIDPFSPGRSTRRRPRASSDTVVAARSKQPEPRDNEDHRFSCGVCRTRVSCRSRCQAVVRAWPGCRTPPGSPRRPGCP